MNYSNEIQCLLLQELGELPQGRLRKKVMQLAADRGETFDKHAYLGALDDLIHLRRIRPDDGNWVLLRRSSS